MGLELVVALVAVFLSVALLTGTIASGVLTRLDPGRRRLSELLAQGPKGPGIVEGPSLAGEVDPFWDPILNALPTSRGTVARLRRQMALAGYYTARAAAVLSIAEIISPIVLGGLPLLLLTDTRRWVAAVLGAALGYFLPGLLFDRRVSRRRKEVQNGLADALDLLVLCLEAGSSLDQAIVKASEELDVSYPALADQLRVMTSEMRAGKPRLEAFRGLASRTQVDDVRALVSMLVQTDRFGTSVAQALRTHADVCRQKRRQRAEEQAQKVGVKLVFPLVFCLFPALYVVMLGPAFIQFMHIFAQAAK